MSEPQGKFAPHLRDKKTGLVNKNFLRFLFSFIAVIACVLFAILSLGVGSNV